jgi:predicted molibdopterin-dependent oxidoreductase YjgC
MGATNQGQLCVKGRFAYDYASSPKRLTVPLIKKDGKFVEASWEEAYDLVVSKFKEAQAKYGTEKLGVLASAKISNEDNYLAQKFARVIFKNNNVDICARL